MEVLLRPKLRLDPDRVRFLLALMEATGELVKPAQKVSVSPDEADNRFLECAEEAKAEFIVTGNKRDFPSKWGTTKVVNARELLQILGGHQ